MTAKSESKKDGMMTMSADTLAARIRERAREQVRVIDHNESVLRVEMFDGNRWFTITLPPNRQVAELQRDCIAISLAAFALSELSAAEKAAKEMPSHDDIKNVLGNGWKGFKLNDEDDLDFVIGQIRLAIMKCQAIRNRETKPRQEPGLSHEDICRLGRVFLEHSNWGRDPQDSRIHEWLKSETAIRNREQPGEETRSKEHDETH